MTLFRESVLPTLFRDGLGNPIRAGLAGRGYFSTNPERNLSPHLWTGIRKPKNGQLTEAQKKANNLVSTVRIEVERALGRLKMLQRLVVSALIAQISTIN